MAWQITLSASATATQTRPVRPHGRADDETVAHLGDNERALDPAVVVDRGLVASRDRFGDQRPQAVVAFADRVRRHRMPTRLHAVGDAPPPVLLGCAQRVHRIYDKSRDGDEVLAVGFHVVRPGFYPLDVRNRLWRTVSREISSLLRYVTVTNRSPEARHLIERADHRCY